jgi:hypothetical protein
MVLCVAFHCAAVVRTTMVRNTQPTHTIDRTRSAGQATSHGAKRSEFSEKKIIGSFNDVCLEESDGMAHPGYIASDATLFPSGETLTCQVPGRAMCQGNNVNWAGVHVSSAVVVRDALCGTVWAYSKDLLQLIYAYAERCVAKGPSG